MKTLLLVDIQNDFLPGGALPIKEGNLIIPFVKDLVQAPFDLVIATKDWHPPDHGSFASVHNKNSGDTIDLFGAEQILWPIHCVRNTSGSEFAPGWDTTCINRVFYKGVDPNIDSYSAFFDNKKLKSTGLGEFLKEKNVKEFYIAGFALEYCIKYTVLDALALGFQPYIIMEACRGINLRHNDSDDALRVMSLAGAKFISFGELMLAMTK